MGQDYRWWQRYTLGSIYPELLSRMADVPPEKRPGLRILDMPAGYGAMSLPLKAAGFDVVPCDLFPEYLDGTVQKLAGQPFEKAWHTIWKGKLSRSLKRRLFGADEPSMPADLKCSAGDLEQRFPFDDGAFDWLLFVEGIEHLENRHHALREMRRVVKPGGTLILTTPNMLSLRARMSMAITGQRSLTAWFDEHVGAHARSEDGSRIYHGHAFLVDYFELRYSLHNCGFRIRRLLPTRKSFMSLLLWPFMFPFVGLLTWRACFLGRKRFEEYQRKGRIPQDAETPHPEMLRHLLSPEALVNRVLVIEAEAV